MFLSKRKNGYYYVVYTNSDGSRTLKSTGSTRKSEAYKFLTKFEQLTKDSQNSLPELTLKEFIVKYMQYSEAHHSQLTSRDYQLTFEQFQKFIGDIRISDITMEMIQSYITVQIKSRSIYQARKDLINIKAAFNWIVKEKYLRQNPAAEIKRIKPPEKLPVYFTREEFKTLLAHVEDDDLKDLIVVAVNTGMRQGELINLRWKSIDIVNRFVTLDNQYFQNKSKRVRSIPLNESALNILKKRLRSDLNGTVFTYLGEPIKQDFIVHKFKKYVRAAKLKDELNFHSLRHTFASWLVQNGIPIYQISTLLGHADIKTTQIYAHLKNENLIEAVSKI